MGEGIFNHFQRSADYADPAGEEAKRNPKHALPEIGPVATDSKGRQTGVGWRDSRRLQVFRRRIGGLVSPSSEKHAERLTSNGPS